MLVSQVEADARAYRAGIVSIPLQVQETVQRYDGSGHLKSTRRSSYSYSFQPGRAAASSHARAASPGAGPAAFTANLDDSLTLPFVFLPGSLAHLSVHAEAPGTGPWIVHFKSTPCPAPDLSHRWLGVNINSQCVEGEAFLDPANGAITRIRMKMGGLPVYFRSLPFPVQVEVYDLYNDTTFAFRQVYPRGPLQLVPAQGQYVLSTSRGRTVVERVFQPGLPQHT